MAVLEKSKEARILLCCLPNLLQMLSVTATNIEAGAEAGDGDGDGDGAGAGAGAGTDTLVCTTCC